MSDSAICENCSNWEWHPITDSYKFPRFIIGSCSKHIGSGFINRVTFHKASCSLHTRRSVSDILSNAILDEAKFHKASCNLHTRRIYKVETEGV